WLFVFALTFARHRDRPSFPARRSSDLQAGKAHVKALYNFCASLPCDDGAAPLGGLTVDSAGNIFGIANLGGAHDEGAVFELSPADRKSTRLNSSHVKSSYAVLCLKKKK